MVRTEAHPELVEDAAELQFGPAFQNAECMLLDEVFHYLELREHHTKNPEAKANTLAASVVAKTKAYCERFGTHGLIARVPDLKRQMSRTLESGAHKGESLHPFQLAGIVNLQPDNAEEAKAIIPSLSHFDDDEVEHFLQVWRENATV
eukprot:GGOE01036169.1.p1 GENE.GGOE01036169.1~~GGOE01036169.1.p1  ORF type:complete len:148 (+),score=41.57 GGOE01036169.1:85-528(+)